MKKTTKKRSASPRKQAEEAGRNVRGGKTIIGARRRRDAKLGSIMSDLAKSRKRK